MIEIEKEYLTAAKGLLRIEGLPKKGDFSWIAYLTGNICFF